MKALVYSRIGDSPESLAIREMPRPRPGRGQVLIQVKACALNVADVERYAMSPEGRMPPVARLMCMAMGVAGRPIGAEIAGIVVETGSDVTAVDVGDEVFGKTSGMFPHGGAAEYALMDTGRVCRKPRGFTFEQAAAVSISFETALGAIRTARVGAGQHVMVYGSSGGVGLYAVQLAKAAGAEVTGVCSTRNIDVARRAGCDHVIDYQTEDFSQTAERYDAIIGVNGHNPMSVYEKLLGEDGIFVGVGDARQGFAAMARSITSRRFTYIAGIASPQRGYLDYAKELAETGRLKPHLDHVYTVHEAPQAIRHMLDDHAQGKIVLAMDW